MATPQDLSVTKQHRNDRWDRCTASAGDWQIITTTSHRSANQRFFMHNSATVHRMRMPSLALDSSRSQLCSDTSTGVMRHQITKWQRLQKVVSYDVLHHRPTCKTTFASLTQSQAISQSFRVFISFRSMRDTTFFHFPKLFFIQNYRFLYHGDQKISWWTLQVAGSQLRNPPVKFRHERWLHLAIYQHPACPNRGRLELWPRKWFLLGQNPWR